MPPAAQTYAATRRAMGAEAFDKAMQTGKPLPDILQRDTAYLPQRQAMPWLADLAEMEHAAAESIITPAKAPLDTEGLESAARDPMTLDLHLQPHIRLLRSGWDIPAIWQALAAGKAAPDTLPPAESFTVVYNDNGNAAVWSVTEAAYVLLENLQSAPSFALAASAALRVDSGFALDRFLAMLVQQQLLATE